MHVYNCLDRYLPSPSCPTSLSHDGSAPPLGWPRPPAGSFGRKKHQRGCHGKWPPIINSWALISSK